MHWKKPWDRKSHQVAGNHPASFYSRLREEIRCIREQGEPPQRDGESFSRYSCDLCHRTCPVSSLRQCVICGRWSCPECWNQELYVCSSCNGIIRLHQIVIPEFKSPSDQNPEEESAGADTEQK